MTLKHLSESQRAISNTSVSSLGNGNFFQLSVKLSASNFEQLSIAKYSLSATKPFIRLLSFSNEHLLISTSSVLLNSFLLLTHPLRRTKQIRIIINSFLANFIYLYIILTGQSEQPVWDKNIKRAVDMLRLQTDRNEAKIG